MILDNINKPNDIKKVNREDYPILAGEIREFLIDKISKSGGHLASNLGVVELTMALHLVFSLPKDKIIWDVGHQSYTHKILTGRKDQFDGLRKFGGMSGFPKRNESRCDAFDTGHSSTSISAGLGYVQARNVLKEDYHVISVIGDGALTGGMAYEALNNASQAKGNFIIVLNDNKMSISKNVGGVSQALNEVRSSNSYIDLKESVVSTLNKMPNGDRLVKSIKKTKDNIKNLVMPTGIFEAMGLSYLGPVDGHDINKLIRIFNAAKKIDGPVIVHVVTKKGKGYLPAEKNPSKFHGITPFNIETGVCIGDSREQTYTKVFSDVLCEIAGKDKNVCAITAAMPDGTGLKKFQRWYPDRFFDVGIAEEHATTFCAGLAAGGMKPVFAVYSSFLQRAYDQIVHDVCIQHLHVVFAVDRAGLVGSDGETHQGIFDISFLTSIPNMTVFAPKNAKELKAGLKFGLEEFSQAFAIRYPRGLANTQFEEFNKPIVYGESEEMYFEKDVALFALGSMVETANIVRNSLKARGYNVTLVNARFAKPFDGKEIKKIAENHKLLVTFEENVICGGMGESICHYVQSENLNLRVMNIALPDDYVEHGNVDILKKEEGIDPQTVIDKIIDEYVNL